MKRFFTSGFCAVLILGLIVSCASTGNTVKSGSVPVTSAKAEPKFVEIKVWKVQESTTAYPDGILSSINRFGYDENGNLLKEEELTGSKISVSRKEYTYSKDGISGISTFNSNGDILGKTRYEYTSGVLIRESLLNAKDEVQSTIDYSYDAKGKKTSRVVKTVSGNQVLTQYVWNKENLVKTTIFDSGQAILKRYDRIYGKTGLLDREEEYGPDGQLTEKTLYTYNGKIVVREEKQNATGGILSAVNYINDADGNPVEIDYVDRLGQPVEIRRQTWQTFTHTVPVQ